MCWEFPPSLAFLKSKGCCEALVRTSVPCGARNVLEMPFTLLSRDWKSGADAPAWLITRNLAADSVLCMVALPHPSLLLTPHSMLAAPGHAKLPPMLLMLGTR